MDEVIISRIDLVKAVEDLGKHARIALTLCFCNEQTDETETYTLERAYNMRHRLADKQWAAHKRKIARSEFICTKAHGNHIVFNFRIAGEY